MSFTSSINYLNYLVSNLVCNFIFIYVQTLVSYELLVSNNFKGTIKAYQENFIYDEYNDYIIRLRLVLLFSC